MDENVEREDAAGLVGRWFFAGHGGFGSKLSMRWGRIVDEAGQGIYLVEFGDPDAPARLVKVNEMFEDRWDFYDTEERLTGVVDEAHRRHVESQTGGGKTMTVEEWMSERR